MYLSGLPCPAAQTGQLNRVDIRLISLRTLAFSSSQQISTSRTVAESGSHPPESQVAIAESAAAGQNSLPNTLRLNIPPPSLARDAEPDLRDFLQRVEKLKKYSVPGSLYGLSETDQDILARQSDLQDSHIILNKTRILRFRMGIVEEE